MTYLLLLLALTIFFFYFLQKHKTKKIMATPPGPRGLPFIGNLHQLDNSDLHRYLWQLSKKYGPLISLRLGFVPTVVVSSAKMAEQFLKTHDRIFAGRPYMLGQQKLSYDGIDLVFTPNVDYWKEIRKLCVMHLFNPKRVQSFRPIREDEVSLMIRKISQSALSDRVTNLSEMVMSFTSSLICRIAFGKRYEDEGNERSRFHGLLSEAQNMMATFFFSDYFPFMGWVDRFRGLLWRLEKNFKNSDRFYQEIINDHVNPNRSKTDQEDFIDICLGLMKDCSFPYELTWDHIKAILMNIFIAGTDTGAAALVWTMTMLIKNPKVMHKVQKEIQIQNKGKDFINEDDVQRLPYLKAVVKETLRLYPPAPLMVPRESTESCQIENYTIKAKTMVYFNVWAIGRDPQVWDDPEEFYPERFMNCPVDFKGQDFGFIPFGAGRRICPGIHMGVAAVELALANLLSSFDWELPVGMKIEDLDTEVLPGITMHKKNALCLMAKMKTH